MLIVGFWFEGSLRFSVAKKVFDIFGHQEIMPDWAKPLGKTDLINLINQGCFKRLQPLCSKDFKNGLSGDSRVFVRGF
ncbi:hypothetical protein A4S05_22100 [Nostoc sp. KVJ20]|nr:hypothetical protein A4S05_22100 [Nostoc sp. KVJ20]